MTVNLTLAMVAYIWNCSPGDQQHELIACRTITSFRSAPETPESLYADTSTGKGSQTGKPPEVPEGESFIRREEPAEASSRGRNRQQTHLRTLRVKIPFRH